jgi:hypothetical protein
MLESLEVLPGWNPALDDGSPLGDSQEEPLRAIITFVPTTPPGTPQTVVTTTTNTPTPRHDDQASPPIWGKRRKIGCDEVDRDLASESSFAIAREWITQCCRDHASTCGNAANDPVLPTGVVEVGDQTSAV